MVRAAISAMTAMAESSALKENELGIEMSLTAVTAKLMGLTLETSCIHVGIAVTGTSAVLMKSSGKVRKPPIANTVSELLVLRPRVREIPDQANPKNAMMKRVTRAPASRVGTLNPKGKLRGGMIEN